MTTNKSWFRCAAGEDGSAEISIYDEIGLWGVTAKDFQAELKALGAVGQINLSINSPGGDVFDGLAIHNMLRRHKASVTVTVDGIAASIASVIAMAGDDVIIPSNAMMMIHDPSGVVVGTSKDMREIADALDKVKTGLVSAYAAKSGMEREDIAALMADETWLTAEEAVAMGFADAIEEAVQMAAKFDLTKFKNAPKSLKARRSSRGKPAAHNHGSEKEMSMTDANENPVVEPEAPVQPEQAAGAIETPAVETESAEQIDARVRAEEKQRVKDIHALCAIANKPDRAADFIDRDMSPRDVQAALLADRKSEKEIVNHNSPAVGNDAASWDKMVDRANARIGG